jgi:hypothetical protein
MDKHLRIATWNLNRLPESSGKKQPILDQMKLIAPDIWVLTETSESFSPGVDYTLIARTGWASDLKREECWTAIWSKVPAELVEVRIDSQRLTAMRTKEKRAVLVIGTVLPWTNDPRRSATGAAGFCQALREQSTEWQRLKESESWAGWCVAGDFNQDLRTTGHYYGSWQGREELLHVLQRLDLKCLTGGSDDPLNGLDGHWCIDHICVGGSLRPSSEVKSVVWPHLAHEELKAAMTDHYGVDSQLVYS